MYIRSRFLISLLFLTLSLCVSGSGSVQVHFPGSEGQSASLHAYEDLMNYQLKKIDQLTVDRKGDFRFELNTTYPQKLVLQVGFVRFSFYSEPDQDYIINVDTIDFQNPALYPMQVISYVTPHYQVQASGDVDDLNSLLTTFSDSYNRFLNRNYLNIYQKRNMEVIVDSADQLIRAFQDSTESIYAHVHADVQIGQLHLLSRRFGAQQMVDSFFSATHIKYRNMSYMDFFNMYWQRYLLTKAKGFNRDEFDSIVNTSRSFATVDALLAKDPLLQDSVLRQLVLLRNLQDMYVSRDFSREAITELLFDIAGHPRHPEHQRIAVNMRKIFGMYEKGTVAPDFQLQDFTGVDFNLESFRGKYVVISAFSLQCMDCLAEMNYMVELNEEFDDIIQFISVSVDQDTEEVKAYVKQKGYKWMFASFTHDFLRDYEVNMLPSFILIDKEGKIENYACPFPSQYFQDYFIQMLNEKKGNLD